MCSNARIAIVWQVPALRLCTELLRGIESERMREG
jgi:hypothetical protein